MTFNSFIILGITVIYRLPSRCFEALKNERNNRLFLSLRACLDKMRFGYIANMLKIAGRCEQFRGFVVLSFLASSARASISVRVLPVRAQT